VVWFGWIELKLTPKHIQTCRNAGFWERGYSCRCTLPFLPHFSFLTTTLKLHHRVGLFLRQFSFKIEIYLLLLWIQKMF